MGIGTRFHKRILYKDSVLMHSEADRLLMDINRHSRSSERAVFI